MKAEKFLIHLFKTINGFYIFDVNTNSILKIDKNTYEFLDGSCTYEDETILKKIEGLRENGYLTSVRDFEMIHPADEMLEDILSRKLDSITLQVTQNCNLRCKYCVYSGSYVNRAHSNKRMKRETALKAIDFLIDNSVDASKLNMGFYGGEPLLEFTLIKECIEYARKKGAGKEITFHMTTNATLLTLEKLDFLSKNNVNLTISLDGPREMHNNNRIFASNGCGSFDKVIKNVEMIKENYPDFISRVNFNTVIDPKNSFNCVNEFFSNYENIKEFYVTTSLLNENYKKDDIKYSKEYIVKNNYEIFKMFLMEVGKLDESDVSKLVTQYYAQLRDDLYKRLQIDSKGAKRDCPSGQCVPGGQRLFIDVEGNLYPCERVSETSKVMKIGSLDDGFYYDRIRKILNIGRITENKCRNCWAFRFCNLCAAACDDAEDLSPVKRMEGCSRVKASADNMLKDYCTLREFGCNFNDDVFTISDF